MKIGDVVYRFDENRRVYRDKSFGGGGGPVYREHFEPLKIVGENRVSWILEHGWKVNKKTFRGEVAAYQFGGRGFFTAEGMENDIWDHEHRHKIVDAVRRVATIDQLRRVADILGYTELTGGKG